MANEARKSTFDSDTQRIASVYAEAYLAAAATAGKTETLVRELDTFVGRVLDAHPDFQRLLESTFVSHEQKVAVIDRVLGGRAAPELAVFLKVLCRRGRLDHLRPIRQALNQQYRAARGQVDVVLRGAQPLGEALRQDLAIALRQALGAEPAITEVTDPTLIGGLVVTVGDTVYDGSVKTRLAQMRESMVARCVAAYETDRARFVAARKST
jgi:F-type H+-transporting ATPase subunit delta